MPTEDPIQVRILTALQEYLETEIVEGDEYFFTLAGQVHIGRMEFDDGDGLPLVSILEVPLPGEQWEIPRGAAVTAGPWEMFVQGWTREEDKGTQRTDRFNTVNAYRLKQDITRALLKLKNRLDPHPSTGEPLGYVLGFKEIDNILVQRGTVRPDEERSGVCTFWTPLTLDLVGA
jgi:hypothetical protein